MNSDKKNHQILLKKIRENTKAGSHNTKRNNHDEHRLFEKSAAIFSDSFLYQNMYE